MQDTQIRLECLKIASLQSGLDTASILSLSQKLYDWLTPPGQPEQSAPKTLNKPASPVKARKPQKK